MSDKKPERKRESFLTALFKFMFTGRRKNDAEMSIWEEEQIQSPGKTVMKEFLKRKLTVVGLVGVTVVFLGSMIIPFFLPVDDTDRDIDLANVPPSLTMGMMRVPRELRDNIAMISSGSGFAIGLSNDGDVYLWGSLGGEGRDLAEMPVSFDDGRGGRIVHISAGRSHALALSENGYVFAWGFDHFAARPLDVPDEIQGRVVHVEGGLRTSVAILDNGNIHVFGGINNNLANITPARVPAGATVADVVINSWSALVRTDCGQAVVLAPTDRVFRDVPEEIQFRVVDIALADRNGAAILDDGTVVVWGGAEYVMDIPEHIQGRAVAIGAGDAHFTVILDDSSVYSWGYNRHGQSNSPNITGVVDIYIGGHHNYALLEDGSVVTWGLTGFLFGSDGFGRDIFARVWSAGRYSLLIGFIAVVIATIIGVTLGSLAGYFGGTLDFVAMRFAEAVGSLPFFPLALILNWRFAATLNEVQALMLLMVVLGLLTWPPIMRLVRGQVLQARNAEYVIGARALGVKEGKIIRKHIMPNILSVVIVQFALGLAASMLTESTLSFVGFGINPPTPTWGNMLTGVQDTIILRTQWWRWVFPAATLLTVTMSINLIGDGLREAFDPRTRGR